MSEIVDAELSGEQGLLITEGPLLPFQKPSKFEDLSGDIITQVDIYMLPVVFKATKRRVDIEKILKNAQRMFKNTYRYDNLWLQHCAASLREILSFVSPGHFFETHASITEADPGVIEIMKFLMHAKSYLGDVVHFRDANKNGFAEKLYPNKGYGQMTNDEFLKQEESFFNILAIDIVCTLQYLFAQYCEGGKPKKQ